MGDAVSNAEKEKRRAMKYLAEKGWKEDPPTGHWGDIRWWHDPVNEGKRYFFDDAWDIQYKRDEEEHLKSQNETGPSQS